MKLRGGEFSTGTRGNFQPELTQKPPTARRASPKRAQETMKGRSPGSIGPPMAPLTG